MYTIYDKTYSRSLSLIGKKFPSSFWKRFFGQDWSAFHEVGGASVYAFGWQKAKGRTIQRPMVVFSVSSVTSEVSP